jgi:hypothetical protein
MESARRKVPRIPKARRVEIGRDEFNQAVDILNQRSEIIESQGKLLAQMRRDLDIQFERIAQLQHQLDRLEKSVARVVGV